MKRHFNFDRSFLFLDNNDFHLKCEFWIYELIRIFEERIMKLFSRLIKNFLSNELLKIFLYYTIGDFWRFWRINQRDKKTKGRKRENQVLYFSFLRTVFSIDLLLNYSNFVSVAIKNEDEGKKNCLFFISVSFNLQKTEEEEEVYRPSRVVGLYWRVCGECGEC